MPDDLYERDILTWSEHQAELLRRLARGERVNGVDWAHVVEEIEDVGLSQFNAVQCDLRLLIVHLLKVHGWPGAQPLGKRDRRVPAKRRPTLRTFYAAEN